MGSILSKVFWAESSCGATTRLPFRQLESAVQIHLTFPNSCRTGGASPQNLCRGKPHSFLMPSPWPGPTPCSPHLHALGLQGEPAAAFLTRSQHIRMEIQPANAVSPGIKKGPLKVEGELQSFTSSPQQALKAVALKRRAQLLFWYSPLCKRNCASCPYLHLDPVT